MHLIAVQLYVPYSPVCIQYMTCNRVHITFSKSLLLFLLSPPLNVLDPSTGDTKIINWIEAKHFYGCGTIPTDGKSACGKIPKTSEKYRRNFGPGAFVFCYGICEELRAKLGEDVCVLDESILDLTETEALMALYCTRSWDGMLLP